CGPHRPCEALLPFLPVFDTEKIYFCSYQEENFCPCVYDMHLKVGLRLVDFRLIGLEINKEMNIDVDTVDDHLVLWFCFVKKCNNDERLMRMRKKIQYATHITKF